MSSWIDSWLAGGKLGSDKRAESPVDTATRSYRGERLGLPEHGVGSAASMGKRLLGFLIDCVLASLVTLWFVHPDFRQSASMQQLNYWAVLTWFLITVIGTSWFGCTPGMTALGIRVVRLDGVRLLGPLRAIPRAVLVALLVPATVWNADGRGLHDRAVGTVVLNAR